MFDLMRTASLTLAAALIAAPLSATAQHGLHGPHPGASMADQHRWEMERLRAEADRHAAFAARQQLETQLALMRLEAARQPPVAAGPTWPSSRADIPTPEVEAARRNQADRTSQIDAWLDRAPRR